MNVYSPCSYDEKKVWRDILLLSKRCLGGGDCCIVGDFNVVASVDERKGVGGTYSSREIFGFNHIISEMELVDVPYWRKNLHGLA